MNKNIAGENRPRGAATADWKSDVLASVVVFLVALPLCMGISIASGVPVAMGLITGIVAGVVVGALAGCPLQVSGPAAGLTVIVFDVVREHGIELLGPIVLLAGLMQSAAGVLRFGQWFRAVSPAVVRGMLSGIGFLIIGGQFHVMIDDKPHSSGAKNLATIPSAIWKSLEVPVLPDRLSRRNHVQALKEIGELHRRQSHLLQFVEHHLREVPGDVQHPGGRSLTTRDLAWIQREQELIGEEAARITERSRDQLEPEIVTALDDTLALCQRVQAAAQEASPEPTSELLEGLRATRFQFEELLASCKSHHLAGLLGIVTIVMTIFWPLLAKGRLKAIPAPLIGVVAATLLASIVLMPVLYVEIPNRLWEEIQFPRLAPVGAAGWTTTLKLALALAVVASAETLLCASAVDQMHLGPRTRYDQELLAQGLGNAICGLVGALPMTGVIVRSSANVQAGGRTRLSAILHGVWLVVFASGLAFLLRLIPTASLAAVLVYTGYKLIDIKAMSSLWKYSRSEAAIYLITMAVIVFSDLLTGVIVGLSLSICKLIHHASRLDIELTLDGSSHGAVLRLAGAATFLRLPKLAATLERIPPAIELRVDFERLNFIDHACLDLLTTWSRQHESLDGRLVLDWDSLHKRFNR